MKKSIAFQGELGAYSDMACRAVHPEYKTMPCVSFDDAMRVVADGTADLAMIPIDNSIAGRVADVHHLLPNSGLHIVGEYFQPIRHCLLGVKGAHIDDAQTVHSHIHALPQCRQAIKQLGLREVVEPDTAAAARHVAAMNDVTQVAIASSLAADIYGLDILIEDMQDAAHNTTRFLIMSRDDQRPDKDDKQDIITSIIFDVMSVPAALHKALSGFAAHGINMTKLESYMIDGQFKATRFYAEVDGHPDTAPMMKAFEVLDQVTHNISITGVYAAHEFRQKS